jgi:competence protein ComFC
MDGRTKGPTRRLLGDALKLAELLVFPSLCRVCGRLLEKAGERVVCRSCLDALAPRRSGFCVCCGDFFDGVAEPHLCLECLTSRPPYALHRSCAVYEGNLREIILLLKYRGYRVLGRDLARFALKAAGRHEDLWWGLDAIIPVPLHPKRKRERGFNQAEVVAREIGRAQGLPVLSRVLRRVKNIPAQTSLEAADRKRNVSGAFAVRQPAALKGRVVLLVDDVYTTGSTVKECCRTLRRAGARSVRVLTLART